MLVLSRKKGERICIGDGITVCVVDIRGDKVRLGVDAPGDVPVHRQEVKDAIEREGHAVGTVLATLRDIRKERCQNDECPGRAKFGLKSEPNMFEVTAMHESKHTAQGVGCVVHAHCVCCDAKHRFFIPQQEYEVTQDAPAQP